jgi:hypothetical protein
MITILNLFEYIPEISQVIALNKYLSIPFVIHPIE